MNATGINLGNFRTKYFLICKIKYSSFGRETQEPQFVRGVTVVLIVRKRLHTSGLNSEYYLYVDHS